MEQIPVSDNRGEIIQYRRAEVMDLRLDYRLFESVHTLNRRHVYSIAVSVSPVDPDPGANPDPEHSTGVQEAEEAFVYDVTRLRKRALSLFRVISEGLVTPCTLTDVLEDLL